MRSHTPHAVMVVGKSDVESDASTKVHLVEGSCRKVAPFLYANSIENRLCLCRGGFLMPKNAKQALDFLRFIAYNKSVRKSENQNNARCLRCWQKSGGVPR